MVTILTVGKKPLTLKLSVMNVFFLLPVTYTYIYTLSFNLLISKDTLLPVVFSTTHVVWNLVSFPVV